MSLEHRLIRVAEGGLPAPSGNREEFRGGPSVPPEGAFTPSIDIYESDEGLILVADLPGVSEASLRVELQHNVLALVAEVDRGIPDEVPPLHEESRIGAYYRSFILSDEVDKDRVRAELKDGVLRLILPRSDRPKARRIEVRTT